MGRSAHFEAGASSYRPEPGAPAAGEWDRSGKTPRWRQDHRVLVQDALHSMKGSHSTMTLHMRGIAAGERPEAMSSGSGKQMQTQAAALLHEVQHNPKTNTRTLYRGDTSEPSGELQAWSERRAVAKRFAGKTGVVHKAPKGTVTGLRVADHITNGLDDDEREWIGRRR